MIKAIYTALIPVYITTLFVIPGCQKNEEEDQSEIYTQETTNESYSTQQGIFLNEVLDLWEEGETESAAKNFVLINWGSSTTFSKIPVMNLTEDNYVLLSGSERENIDEEYKKFVPMLSRLAKHVLKLGRASIAKQDYEMAEKQFNAVLQCGEVLSRARTVDAIRLTGPSFKVIALKELVQLYTQTKNQVKLKTAQDSLENLQ